jgi:hypothetical protein
MQTKSEHLLLRDAPRRPAIANLIAAMAKLAPRQRNEICRMGRKARAAKAPRLRRLAREAAAEARSLAEMEGAR